MDPVACVEQRVSVLQATPAAPIEVEFPCLLAALRGDCHHRLPVQSALPGDGQQEGEGSLATCSPGRHGVRMQLRGGLRTLRYTSPPGALMPPSGVSGAGRVVSLCWSVGPWQSAGRAVKRASWNRKPRAFLTWP